MKIKIKETGNIEELKIDECMGYNQEDYTADVLQSRYDSSISQDDEGVYYMTQEQYEEYVDAVDKVNKGEEPW